jgi:uncharacterized protein (DUF433 family)
MAKEHLTLRVPSEVMRDIAHQAARSGRPVTTLAADLLEEGLIMRVYPGIGFRDGAVGRRPALMGTRIDVRHVVETVNAEAGDLESAAKYFGVPVGLIRAAMEYYSDHHAAVDAWIEREHQAAAEAEARWHRGDSTRSA